MSKLIIFKTWRRIRVNLGVAVQTRWLKIRRGWPRFIGGLQPYTKRRFWPVYLFLFAIAFYLYGPTAGLHKIRTLIADLSSASMNHPQPAKMETLQKELTLLKTKLREQETASKTASKRVPFDSGELSRPVLGLVNVKYEWLQTDHTWRLHPGVDIAAGIHSNVIAAAAGTIRRIEEAGNGSYTVTLDHGDLWESVYGNLDSVLIREGQKILKGVIIGRSGNAGCIPGQPGVHFAIYHDGQSVNPQSVVKGL